MPLYIFVLFLTSLSVCPFLIIESKITITAFNNVSTTIRQSKLPIKHIYSNTIESELPVVINTWAFYEAGKRAWSVLSSNGTAVDAVEKGCSECERLQCDGTVGYGGSPDENGETTLDAMIMDGETHDVGAVGDLRKIKSAISVARYVMERTTHTMLVGEQATAFALSMGFPLENLTTQDSLEMHNSWKKQNCQPNFWKNVSPNPTTSCGPYKPVDKVSDSNKEWKSTLIDSSHHDTIGMIALDGEGCIAAGTSTNGARNKIPGRIGDSPIPGSGAYVDKNVGGAAATGDGDVMMRFLPSLITVEGMRAGLSPSKAASDALRRILQFYPSFSGAIVALDVLGVFGASCTNLPLHAFNYTVANEAGIQIQQVNCIEHLSEGNEIDTRVMKFPHSV